MSTITQSRRGSAAAMAAVLAGVAVVAPPAGAASPHEYNAGYREKVAMAGAIWNAATDTTTTVMELQVYELTSQRIPARPDSRSLNFRLFYDHEEVDETAGTLTTTSYEGFSAEDLKFDFDPALRGGATVTGTTELNGWRCVIEQGEPGEDPEYDCVDLPTLTVEVNGRWAQAGPIHRDTEQLSEGIPADLRAHSTTVTASSNAELASPFSDVFELVNRPADTAVLILGNYSDHILVR